VDEGNDGRFPDDSLVEVRYPRTRQEELGERSARCDIRRYGRRLHRQVTALLRPDGCYDLTLRLHRPAARKRAATAAWATADCSSWRS
jgi:hypothetical protein